MRRRDAGMTLIELIVSVAVIGLIVVSISVAITVVLRQAPQTEARLDVSRWEQNLGTWLPADLASAEGLPADTPEHNDPDDSSDYPTDPDYPAPAGCGDCTDDVNVLQLHWGQGSGTTDVTYRYGVGADPDTYELRRVECTSSGCDSIVLARDLPAPDSDGTLPVAIQYPPDVASVDNAGNDTTTQSARNVTITIRDLNDPSGESDLVFSGGGANLTRLEPASIDKPDFLKSDSACGGPITLIVDESGSIGDEIDGAIGDVRDGVRSFVEIFSGTPTDLQIVRMDSVSSSLGAESADDWNVVFDMTDDVSGGAVERLLGDPDDESDSGLIGGIASGGLTNWEDAFFRALYWKDGNTYEEYGLATLKTPELIVFFTDGLPTTHRDDGTSYRSGEAPQEQWDYAVDSEYQAEAATNGYSVWGFSPRGWARTNTLIHATHGAPNTRLIGVGVGSAFNATMSLSSDTGLSASQRAAWESSSIPSEVLLGNLMIGALPDDYDDANQGYLVDDFAIDDDGDGSTGWDADIDTVDLLVTTEFRRVRRGARADRAE